jgi:DNA-binding transcriptional ArsR family regulator
VRDASPLAERAVGQESLIQAQLREDLYALHARFCRGLGDPKRLPIIAALRGGERAVSELVEATGASQANVSQHLALMRNLGLVLVRRQGPSMLYRLADPRIAEAVELLLAAQADLQRQRLTSFVAAAEVGRDGLVDPEQGRAARGKKAEHEEAKRTLV